MTTDGKEKGREIDPDKLVHRLLDMIQQQQDELVRARQQLDYVLHTAQLPPSQGLTPPGPIRVDPLGEAGAEPHALPAASPAAGGHTPLSRVLRDNAVFIAACGVLAVATLVIALRPPTTEVVRLGQQLDQAELRLRAAAADQDKVVKERDDQIIVLQKTLSATEAALSQNERALADALGQGQPAGESGGAPAAAPKLTKDQELEQEHSAVESLRRAIVQSDGAITVNRDEFLQDARALAAARLDLYKSQLAVRVLKGEISGADVARLGKSLEDFLPPRAQEMADEAKEPAGEPAGAMTGALPASVDALRELATSYNRLLQARQSKLKFLESAITQAQRDILSTQEELARSQALERSLRVHPPK